MGITVFQLLYEKHCPIFYKHIYSFSKGSSSKFSLNPGSALTLET